MCLMIPTFTLVLYHARHRARHAEARRFAGRSRRRPAETADGRQSSATIRGTALIFWDLKVPGKKKKLDAIDTDQITPAADCVSESLDTLDERWKAGSFRYLMPDFRARVHRGETFLIAGDRFAIGSSREMSPAGLKGVAEEAGLEMVVVCGNNMGDIFRRNALNLGLHVVQSPEAVADAATATRSASIPRRARLTNETQGKTYDPVPLTPKEDEIRRTRRHLRGRAARVRGVREDGAARSSGRIRSRRGGMTTTEQIVWAHRVDKDAEVKPGATLRVYADLLPASDGTAPFAIHTFNQITGGNTIFPRQAAIANDHFVFTGKDDDNKQTAIGRAFAQLHGIEKPVLRDARRRHLSFLFSRAGARDAGPVHPGRRLAQPRVRRVRRGRHGRRIDDARVRLVDRLHLLHARQGAPRRVRRHAAAVGQRQGHRARAAAAVGREAVAGHVGGARRRERAAADRVSQHDREHDGRGGGAERHLRARRDHLCVVSRERASPTLPYPPFAPGAGRACTRSTKRSTSTNVRPMIAKPFSPGNAFPAEEVARERLTFDKAMIGSCTNGSYDDLLSAALVVRAARAHGATQTATEFVVFPGSGGVGRQIEQPDPRLGGESIAEVFRSVGGEIRAVVVRSVLRAGARRARRRAARDHVVQSQLAEPHGPRRRRLSGEPRVVAASALVGYMAPPSELGLDVGSRGVRRLDPRAGSRDR